MWIRSSFKDYYDGVQQYTTGGPVYVREWCTTEKCPVEYKKSARNEGSIVVGFCGKIYRYLMRFSEVKNNGRTEYVPNIYHTFEEFKTRKSPTFFIDRETERILSPLFSIEEDHKPFIALNAPIFVIFHEAFLKERDYNTKRLQFEDERYFGVHYCYSSPLSFTRDKPRVRQENNISLEEFGFDYFLDSGNAYTSLVSYVEFLGREHKEVPEMSNDVKIQSHGFDKKSFRH